MVKSEGFVEKGKESFKCIMRYMNGTKEMCIYLVEEICMYVGTQIQIMQGMWIPRDLLLVMCSPLKVVQCHECLGHRSVLLCLPQRPSMLLSQRVARRLYGLIT